MIIKLTQNKETDVGPRDYKYLSQWSWWYDGNYAARKENGKTIRMHRVILERMGYRDFDRGDHINRNTLNNLRSNLRPATHEQSSCNQNKQSNNTSGYIGISWNKQHKKWRAQISINKKYKFLGYFDSEIEAASVRDQATKKYHGKFAVLNGV